MTTRSKGDYAPHIDFIHTGFAAALLAYPNEPKPPALEFAAKVARAAGRASAVMVLDDWHRGAALARECIGRAAVGLRLTCSRAYDLGGRLPVIARLAVSGATDAEMDDLEPPELEAWDLLCAFDANIAEMGDPDLEMERNDPDEWEQIAGDDEQDAVLSRLRWADDGRGGRVLVSSPWEDCPE